MKFLLKQLYSKWFPVLLLLQFGFAETQSPPNNTFKNIFIMNESGDTLSFDSLSNSKPTLIYLWATWCSTCKIDMRKTENYLTSKLDQLNFLPIAFKDTLPKVLKAKNKMKLNSNIYLDYSGKIFTSQNIKATPTILILNSNGKIIYNGYSSSRKYYKILRELHEK